MVSREKFELDSRAILADRDVYIYFGYIARSGYKELTKIVSAKNDKNDRAILVLVTVGGDPDAGYRIGRALGHYYPAGIDVFVPDICKSAGTLVCIAAQNLIIGDRGELGPLDIQLRKPDEIFENGSGLDIIQSLSALRSANLVAFNEYMVDIRLKAGLSTKIAADIATKLADGLIAPIAGQVDPIRWGEHQRAIYIAHSYGKRLNEKFKNLKSDALDSLVSAYPNHGFVIDRKEASTLFNRVRAPDGTETALEQWVCNIIDSDYQDIHGDEPRVLDLKNSFR
ncbi:MAG: SDH family Clp fold serine proteinase [Alishewanella aestuarii]